MLKHRKHRTFAFSVDLPPLVKIVRYYAIHRSPFALFIEIELPTSMFRKNRAMLCDAAFAILCDLLSQIIDVIDLYRCHHSAPSRNRTQVQLTHLAFLHT